MINNVLVTLIKCNLLEQLFKIQNPGIFNGGYHFMNTFNTPGLITVKLFR